MRRSLLTLIMLFFCSILYAQNSSFEVSSYKKIENTIGERYIVLPLDRDLKLKYRINEVNNDDEQRLDDSRAGLLLKLTSINYDTEKAYFTDSLGNNYNDRITNRSSMPNLAPYNDFLIIKKTLIGKYLWLNTTRLRLGDPKINPAKAPEEDHRFEQVSVTDVVLTSIADFPFAFIVKTTTGKIGFIYTYLSGTNTDLNPEYQFYHNFLTEDPKLKYHFTPKQWADVKTGIVKVGMSLDELILIEGHPTRINTTSTAKGNREQYVYGESSPTYYYLENGKITAIQENH